MKRSRLPISLRISIVVFGALVLLGGFAWRDYEQIYGAGGALAGSMAEDGTFRLHGVFEDAENYSVEPIGSEWGVFHYTDEGESRSEVFRGTEEDAHAWYEAKTTYVAFEGTEAEAQAWDRARQDELIDLFPMNLTIAVGALVILVGLALGWRRRPDRTADTATPHRDPIGVGH